LIRRDAVGSPQPLALAARSRIASSTGPTLSPGSQSTLSKPPDPAAVEALEMLAEAAVRRVHVEPVGG
jgi:hypothetical protein